MHPASCTITTNVCKKHGETDFVIRSDGGRRCKKCRCEAVCRRAVKMKSQLVAIFGGKCSICGYDRYQGALQFHHVNPEEKCFEISDRPTIAFSRLLEEAKKCLLLCANCHAEVGDGMIGAEVLAATCQSLKLFVSGSSPDSSTGS